MDPNKRTIILFLLFLSLGCVNKVAAAPPPAQATDTFPRPRIIPTPRRYVNDFEGLFTTGDQNRLETILRHYDTAQIVVVTLDSSMFEPAELETFTLTLFNTWGIGDSVTNNGILVFISASARMMRIENGFGIEKLLTDEETKQIIDSSFIPFFRQEKYYEGVLAGILEIKKQLAARVKQKVKVSF